MCKIYEFPAAKKLPEELEERLKESAKDYVILLNDILRYFDGEDFDEEGLLEVMETTLTTYLETIAKAIDELGM